MNLVCLVPDRLGDAIALTPLFRTLNGLGHCVHLVMPPKYNDLLGSLKFVHSVYNVSSIWPLYDDGNEEILNFAKQFKDVALVGSFELFPDWVADEIQVIDRHHPFNDRYPDYNCDLLKSFHGDCIVHILSKNIGIDLDHGRPEIGGLFREPKRSSIGLSPGSVFSRARRFSSTIFWQLCELLSEKYNVILLGSINKATQHKFAHPKCINALGDLPLVELAAKIRNLKLLITPDCGLFWMSIAVQTPVLVFPSIVSPSRLIDSDYASQCFVFEKTSFNCVKECPRHGKDYTQRCCRQYRESVDCLLVNPDHVATQISSILSNSV